MNKYFNIDDTVFNITEKFPELIGALVKQGFEPIANPIMRKTMGKMISLRKALVSRNLDLDTVEAELISVIEKARSENMEDSSLNVNTAGFGVSADGKDVITIEGILPCPVRTPLLEKFESFYDDYCKQNADKMTAENYVVHYDLKAASMGSDNVMNKLFSGDANNLPDVTFLVGIDAFLANKQMKKYIDDGVFVENAETRHKIFDNGGANLVDPKKVYNLVAGVPAVFIVNKDELKGRPMPKTWADILKPEFANSISIPLNDLDLFNVVILGIYSLFGKDGIKDLARSYFKNLHPSQMTKAKQAGSGTLPAVNIAPYFFTRMIKADSSVEAVWPEDGAIISPIFLLTKAATKDKTKPFVDLFTSKEMGDVISAGGFFPSMHPDVDNSKLDGKKFIFPSWDLLHSEDLGKVISECKEVFNFIVNTKVSK